MKFNILTLFPDLIYNYPEESILGRAQKAGLIEIKAHNFREWSLDKQRHVDDSPYGGGAGMVLQVEPIYRCLEALGVLSLRPATRRGSNPIDFRLKSLSSQSMGIASSSSRTPRNNKKTKVIIMDPAGKKFDQRMAEKFSKLDNLVIISGRYEGFDERVYKFVDEKISAGDYILAGGELPALTIVEATARLIPGVLGNEESLSEETFNTVIPATAFALLRRLKKAGIQGCHSRESGNPGLSFPRKRESAVEYPQYTRPENFMGLKVPKILLSGDHKKIAEWRKTHTK